MSTKSFNETKSMCVFLQTGGAVDKVEGRGGEGRQALRSLSRMKQCGPRAQRERWRSLQCPSDGGVCNFRPSSSDTGLKWRKPKNGR